MASGEIKAARKRRHFISAGTTDTRPNERLTPRSRSERISRSSRWSRLKLRGKSPVSGVMAIALAPAARILGVAP